jgi:hypothetical protein
MSELETIGRAERISIKSLDLVNVPAKVDTGADSSAIWVSEVKETNRGLECVFFGEGSKFYTGERIIIPHGYDVTRVSNSFGQKELRYKIKLRIRVKGRLISATFTLSDRSKKTYPILLGRRLLRGKFLVDVTQGQALLARERAKIRRLNRQLNKLRAAKEKEKQS